jgi:malonyl-ACP decarboxylase
MTAGDDIVITGLGVTSAVGRGVEAFAAALFAGAHRFGELARAGREHDPPFPGAELPPLEPAEVLTPRVLRTSSLTAHALLVTVQEALADAELAGIPGDRIGLVVGGSNLQQRAQVLAHDRYRDRRGFLPPSYGLSFLDTDLCGLASSTFGITGLAHTVGGASASGQLAVIEAAEAVAAGRVDACVAVGALMDLSYWECLALRSMGAMVPAAKDDPADPDGTADPADLGRPFDRGHRGFVYGEACAAVVVERRGARGRPAGAVHARLAGWSVRLDGNRNPNPSATGEEAVIRAALDRAGLSPDRIDYVNPHGTGSPLGDRTEVDALLAAGLGRARINATKSITGHGLTAAGAVEVVATAVQLRHGRLHPTRNLHDPIDDRPRWVRDTAVAADLRHCLNLSTGFGGINTALVLSGN